MNLQESIRRILREESNIPRVILRRVTLDELDKIFERSLDESTEDYENPLTIMYGQPYKVFAKVVIDIMISELEKNFDILYIKDEYEYNEKYRKPLLRHYAPIIKDRYMDITSNNVDESILREETNHNISDNLKGLSKKIGIENAIKVVGGIERFINIAYNGDIKEYYKNENVRPYYIREGNEINMYFDDSLVQHLNLEDFNEDEKKLGKFKFGRKNDTQYSFDARLRKVNHVTGKVVWKVVGMSGSSGFGYSFIPKRETLAKTYRIQIFQQIVDKYNLNDYK